MARRKIKKKRQPGKPTFSADELDKASKRIEFHRRALALMPDPGDRRPGIAIISDGQKRKAGQRFCSCSTGRSRTCNHLKALEILAKSIRSGLDADQPMEALRNSFWYGLAEVMNQKTVVALGDIRLQTTEQGRLEFFDAKGHLLVTYLSDGADRVRLLERCLPPPEETQVPTRHSVLRQLAALSLTDDERFLNERGYRSRRQAFEDSFWFCFFYHCFQEMGLAQCQCQPVIIEPSGDFAIRCTKGPGQAVFSLPIPRTQVKPVLEVLQGVLSSNHGLEFSPIPLDSIFDVRINSELDLEIQPLVRLIQKDGVVKFFRRQDLARYQYGDLIYIKELGILAEDRYPEKAPQNFKEPVKKVIQRSQVPHFMAQYEAELKSDAFRLDQNLRQLKILRDIAPLQVEPHLLERNWLWISGTYGKGNQRISLKEIIQAKQAGQQYIATAEGWVDTRAEVFNPVDTLLTLTDEKTLTDEQDRVRLSRLSLYKLLSASDIPQKRKMRGHDIDKRLNNLLSMKPAKPLPSLKGLTSPLRKYQQTGVKWLWFLVENDFGGLLCDDMGLGKTHQVMALFAGLQQRASAKHSFLVVCPTTVISHWEKKLAEHTPGLACQVYHGAQRDFHSARQRCDVLLTSYGIMLRDIDRFADHFFKVAVFDEIQNLKNPATKGFAAARQVKAASKIGLTGTPIENSLHELKALFDLTVPGYLGKDGRFEAHYIAPIEQERDSSREKELRRLIFPFTLRRLKKSVLEELPPKIEDVRVCRLSEDQIKLYRDAIKNRAAALIDVLRQGREPVPYIHIFALLNLLKQICNHPALVAKDAKNHEHYQSGKWDLFVELMDEVLDSGQKVVVYSQYLKMIDIIYAYLQGRGVGSVCLTGRTQGRGRVIDRFQKDKQCRVFIGSLKAGGTGIDLISASVVIHYDRWWNAAKEDQATDRIHRIGQTRGVQVIKMITEGTLEEKIDAIIKRKRNLLENIIREDDPNVLKSFNRNDLIELLTMPAGD